MNAPTLNLHNRIAVVSAAGQGIGRAVAERLHAEGAVVHALDINPVTLASLKEHYPAINTVRLDATEAKAVEAFFATLKGVDALVHAVGYVHQGDIEECTPADWQRSLDITLTSAYNVTRAAVPLMKVAGGSITTIGSVASSTKGFARRVAYGAAKGGVIGLTKALAADYIKQKIRCNCVCPGTVASPSLEERIDELAKHLGSREAAVKVFIDRQPAGRLGEPSEIAGICAFLASDQGSFINGQVINVDGGITI